MKQYKLPGFLVLITLILTTQSYSQELRDDQPAKINYGICTDINSKYLWRGISSSEHFVIQPCVSADYKNFNMYVWGNLEPGIREGNKLNEIDISAGYSAEIKKLTIEPSILLYYLPGDEESETTAELVLRFSRPVFKNIGIFTTHSFDFIKYSGSYYGDAGFTFEKWVSRDIGMNFTAGMGWSSKKFNEYYNDVSKSALNVLFLNMGTTYYFSKYFYVKSKLEVQIILDKEIKEASGNKELFNIGITLGSEF
ncbi:MAG: hypothetical protein EHM58_18760 [Ignavibacteriae bacterium]|nr:MAG: hypothetical protein EHM58_18760 [Ignavibacteriota bacterium]